MLSRRHLYSIKLCALGHKFHFLSGSVLPDGVLNALALGASVQDYDYGRLHSNKQKKKEKIPPRNYLSTSIVFHGVEEYNMCGTQIEIESGKTHQLSSKCGHVFVSFSPNQFKLNKSNHMFFVCNVTLNYDDFVISNYRIINISEKKILQTLIKLIIKHIVHKK